MALPMENETKPPAPDPVPDGADPARLHVHLVLGAGIVPPLSLLLGTILAIVGRPAGTPTPEQRRWRRHLMGLLAADFVVAACLAWVVTQPEGVAKPAKEPPAPQIGIAFDPDPAKTEPRVDMVVPGSPADRAGLRAGDLVLSIDETPVGTHQELRKEIRAGEAGAARLLVIRRGEESLDVSVVPELPKKESRPLFEPYKGSKDGPKAEWLSGVAAFLPALAVAGITAFLSRFRRRARVVVWRGFLLAMIGSVAAAAGVGVLGKTLLGGWSLGVVLLSLLGQMVALLGLTWAATAWCGRDVPPPPHPIRPLSPIRALLLGCFYLLTGALRVSIILVTLDQILLGGATAAKTQGIEVLAGAPLGVWGTLLFVANVVVVGPLAEEAIFRGFLLPRLAAQWSGTAGLVVSSLIFALFHPHYGIFMPLVFLYGYVFGWARLRTGGIGVPFVLHLAVNGMVSLIALTR